MRVEMSVLLTELVQVVCFVARIPSMVDRMVCECAAEYMASILHTLTYSRTHIFY